MSNKKIKFNRFVKDRKVNVIIKNYKFKKYFKFRIYKF